jgi:hypothetical protein
MIGMVGVIWQPATEGTAYSKRQKHSKHTSCAAQNEPPARGALTTLCLPTLLGAHSCFYPTHCCSVWSRLPLLTAPHCWLAAAAAGTFMTCHAMGS